METNDKKIKIDRVWAMPNSNTFDIKPIKDLLDQEVDKTRLWIDPFANKNRIARITNDLNTIFDTDYHLDALDFLKIFEDNSVDGVLYDPPYSPRQVSECYNNVGLNVTWDTTKASFWGNHKKEISRIVKIGGKVITFGWNSGGIGQKYGFEIQRILMVPHGGWHNDTICTVEVKTHEPNIKIEEEKKEYRYNMTKNDELLISKLKKLPIDYWDFKEEDVREFTHGIHNYPAMMVCPISRNILRIMNEITTINTLFDPFSGSGTVLVEGMLAGLDLIAGNDINPLAIFLSKVKTTPLNILDLKKESKELTERINHIKCELQNHISVIDNYFENEYKLDLSSKTGWGEDAPSYLRKYYEANNINIDIPSFKNIGYWFKPHVILELSIIKSEINKIENKDIKDFILVAFSETIRYVSNRRTGEFKMYRIPVDKLKNFNPNVSNEFLKILDKNIEKMNDFVIELEKKENHSTVNIYKNSACDLIDVPNDTFDLIITSPPYGDSRTTVAYGEYSRLSLQWLNLYDLSEKEILGVDKSLMGGKKYRNGFEFLLPSSTLKKSLEKIINSDLERAGDVYSFYLDLNDSIKSISKKTKKDGYQFWVVGNRTVKGELLLTDVIISEMANECGMDYVYTIDRNIPNKVMPSLNSPSNVAGEKSTTMTMEHIVVLRKR